MKWFTCDRCGEKVHPGDEATCLFSFDSTEVEVHLCTPCRMAVRVDLVRYIEGGPVSQGAWAGEARWR